MCAVPLKGLQKDDLSLEQLQTLQKLIKKRIPTGAERHALHRAGGCDRRLSGGDVYRHLHARVGLLYMEGCSWSLLCLPAGLVIKEGTDCMQREHHRFWKGLSRLVVR